ncbi:hypothetical protein P7C70_g8056, partial [Phenoliferia sp. Uapishka_3]
MSLSPIPFLVRASRRGADRTPPSLAPLEPAQIPASTSRLAHIPAPVVVNSPSDRLPSASPPLEFSLDATASPTSATSSSFFPPQSLQHALSTSTDSNSPFYPHSGSASPHPPSSSGLPRPNAAPSSTSISSQASFNSHSFTLDDTTPVTTADLALIGRKASVTGSRRKDMKRAMKPHELSHGHSSASSLVGGRSGNPYPYPFPPALAGWNNSGMDTSWGDLRGLSSMEGLVTPPPSVSHSNAMSDYSDSAASGSTFSLSSFADSSSSHGDSEMPEPSLSYALNQELNLNSAHDFNSAHSSALYRSLEHSLSLDPSLAQSLSAFDLPPEPSSPNPSISFPPTVTFPSDLTSQLLLSRTRSRDAPSVAFAPRHPSLSLDRDRDRTLDASLALDRDRDRTLGRELSLDRERDATFKSNSTSGSGRKMAGFKNLVGKVKDWGRKAKGKEKEKTRGVEERGIGGRASRLSSEFCAGEGRDGNSSAVKEEQMDDDALLSPIGASPPAAEDGPSPEGARSIEELLWETIEEVEEIKPGANGSPGGYLGSPMATGDGDATPDYYAALENLEMYDNVDGESKVDIWRQDLDHSFTVPASAHPILPTSSSATSFVSTSSSFVPPSSYGYNFSDPNAFSPPPSTTGLEEMDYNALFASLSPSAYPPFALDDFLGRPQMSTTSPSPSTYALDFRDPKYFAHLAPQQQTQPPQLQSHPSYSSFNSPPISNQHLNSIPPPPDFFSTLPGWGNGIGKLETESSEERALFERFGLMSGGGDQEMR